MKNKIMMLALVTSAMLLGACTSQGERFGIKWNVDLGDQPATIAARMDEPRIAPITLDTANEKQRAALEPLLATTRGRGARNVYGSLQINPEFGEAAAPFLSYILRASSLPPREREILILRTGWRNKALYEWEHHKSIGLDVGLTEDEINAIAKGAGAKTWNDFDAALITAADELKDDAFISDKTWATLTTRYNDQQMVDVIATVGDYTFVSMFLNSIGVQMEEAE